MKVELPLGCLCEEKSPVVMDTNVESGATNVEGKSFFLTVGLPTGLWKLKSPVSEGEVANGCLGKVKSPVSKGGVVSRLSVESKFSRI